MAHDVSKVMMGTTRSSFKVVDNVPGSIAAGLVVCAKSDGTYTTAAADGASVGVSLGISLSGHARTAVCREGMGVPVQVGSGTPVKGAQVAVSDTTGKTVDYTGSGNRYINAVYATAKLTAGGIDESGGAAVDVAIIDFPGGL